ncbi:UNVERIFIED_CONTAM: hypothetical protein GTU68_030271 [Idotea baltica]|nr:hypothetical protein [Idotea baltica]
MLVGNSSVLNMEFNLMVKCHLIRLLEVVMMPSILSSLKQVQESHVPLEQFLNTDAHPPVIDESSEQRTYQTLLYYP